MPHQKKETADWVYFILAFTPIILLNIAVWIYGRSYFILDVVFGVLVSLSILWAFFCLQKWKKNTNYEKEKLDDCIALFEDISLPIVFFDEDLSIFLVSDCFTKLSITQQIQEKIKSLSVGSHRIPLQIREQYYRLYIEKSALGNSLAILIQREISSPQAIFEDSLPVIGYIEIDNYSELSDRSTDDRLLLNNAITLVEKYIKDHDGVVRSYDRGKFIVFIDRDILHKLSEEKFSILDRIREISLSNGVMATLSMAFGAEDTISNTRMAAQDAMALALGRGGDQAVVKFLDNYSFYGGKTSSNERYSRVKSRVFAESLSHLMKQYSNVLIMGHKMADMDALGAAIGISTTATALQKPVNIVLEQDNAMISSYYKTVSISEELGHLFISPEKSLTLCSKATMVIVVDTQRTISTPAPELFDAAGAIVVLDHHLRGVTNNIPATLQITETRSSSTCELVSEALQYFKPAVTISSLTASGMLCGIIVDTKNFTKNTSARTFETAAFLRQHGANNNFVRQVFLEDKQMYLDRAELVRDAENITSDIVLSMCPLTMQHAGLISAQAADALVTIKGIEAAFVLFQPEEGITNVSARSSEDVNVQLILESIGGGGHFHASGATICKPMEEAKDIVIQAVLQYTQDTANK